jgi:cytochrome c biogenesis protein CcdA
MSPKSPCGSWPHRPFSPRKIFRAGTRLVVLGLAALLWLTGALAAAVEHNQATGAERSAAKAGQLGRDADDPFAPANQVKDGRPQTGQGNEAPTTATRTGKPTPIDERIHFEVTIAPRKIRRGEIAQLTVAGTPRPGFHTYPLTQRSANPAQDPSQLCTLTYGSVAGVQPLWPVVESSPQPKLEEGLGWFLEHELPFTWRQELLILPDATPGEKTLPLTIQAQVCNARGCILGEPQFAVKFEVSSDSPVPLTPGLQQRINAKQPELKVVPVGGPAATGPAASPRSDVSNAPLPAETAEIAASVKGDASGLVAFILQGIGWGAISLLTPCVFPMIPITVSFFLKQSEKQHHQPLQMALVYSVTIVLVLTAGAVLLLGFLQALSQQWGTNLVLGVLFVFFALSLFGMYEIRLPTTLANYTSAQESRGGLVGTIFMALTFTIISFTCVAPFLGGFAGLNVQSRPWYEILLGGIAFSVTFAAPFFLLALFPTLLRQLPKSGSWMNAMKVVMGFLELAAALKFFRTAELLRSGTAEFLTYDLVLGIYVALAILCGLYLLNLYRLPHDHDVPEHLGVLRLLSSLLFLSLGFYLAPGLLKQESGEPQRPRGTVFNWVDAFLLRDKPTRTAMSAPSNRTVAATTAAHPKRPTWLGNLATGLRQAEVQKRLLFLNFTGLG